VANRIMYNSKTKIREIEERYIDLTLEINGNASEMQ
jgi:hypothetical protein